MVRVESWTGDWLGRRAACTPQKEALVVMGPAQQGGGGSPDLPPLRLSFAQWNRRANRTAHLLLAQGIGKGDRVGVLAQNCPEVLYLLFACQKLGAIFVPYNWRLSPSELAPMVADSEPALLFWGPQFAEVGAKLPAGQKIPLAGLEERLAAFADAPPPAEAIAPEDPWMILYTGGTTGRSKGAVISHRQALWNAWNTIAGWGLSPGERVPVLTPFFHTGGLHVFTTPLVYLGGTSILMGPFDPERVLAAITEEGVTVLFMVPTMFQMVMNHPGFAAADFGAIRFMISGGAPCPEPIYQAYWQKGVLFKSGYGMTEVGPNCFVLPDHEVKRKIGSVGFPILHAAMRITADDGCLCAPGEVGELQIAGPHLCSGYWRNPQASLEANPDGWFRTGDMAYRDHEGFYYIVDRKKEMFISGGENVFPQEVESVLYHHPAVAEAAVVGVPDELWGEVGWAAVALHPGVSLTETELQAFCRGRLAHYKVPKRVEFRATLPKSTAGKIQKQDIKAEYMVKGRSSEEVGGNSGGVTAPRE